MAEKYVYFSELARRRPADMKNHLGGKGANPWRE